MSTILLTHPDQLLAVTHDLRSPVSSIMAIHGLLKQELASNSSDRSMALLEMIRACCQDAEQLLTNLLRQEIDEAQKTRVELRHADLNEYLRSLAPRLEALAAQYQLTFQLVLPKGETPSVRIDPSSFFRIVNNLFSNALKFTPSGGSICLTTQCGDGCVQMSLTDTGVGMSPAQLSSLFIPGKTTNESTAGTTGLRAEPSYGIGLWIVRQLVELHHGEVTVESEVGKGTRFTIHLPLVK